MDAAERIEQGRRDVTAVECILYAMATAAERGELGPAAQRPEAFLHMAQTLGSVGADMMLSTGYITAAAREIDGGALQ